MEFIARLKIVVQSVLLENPLGIMVLLLVDLSPKLPQSGIPL
jgi:hypothetical protein